MSVSLAETKGWEQLDYVMVGNNLNFKIVKYGLIMHAIKKQWTAYMGEDDVGFHHHLLPLNWCLLNGV